MKKMETLKIEKLAEFVLSNEEMINLRGGTKPIPGGPIGPTLPPIIIEI